MYCKYIVAHKHSREQIVWLKTVYILLANTIYTEDFVYLYGIIFINIDNNFYVLLK